MTLLAKLRMELGIDTNDHRTWLLELMAAKKTNALHACQPTGTAAHTTPIAPAPGPMAGNRNGSMPSSSARGGHAQHPLPPMMGGMGGGGGGGAQSGGGGDGGGGGGDVGGTKKKKKMKLGAIDGGGGGHLGGSGGPSGGTFDYSERDLIGRKVKRFWAESNDWFDGVITDHKASKREYCVTYDLGNSKKESFEWLDPSILVTQGTLKIGADFVNLHHYPKSIAVQSSSVLNAGGEVRRGGDDGGKGGKASGVDYSVGPTGRKRNITATFDPDSDDLNDLL
ncbi:hypothetical protein FOA52_013336 [Chlamydomonas sp. UWO 241]|nr:hypothetical protein FOA52_013336 [Chlamydomonas sp. UWO 241]